MVKSYPLIEPIRRFSGRSGSEIQCPRASFLCVFDRRSGESFSNAASPVSLFDHDIFDYRTHARRNSKEHKGQHAYQS